MSRNTGRQLIGCSNPQEARSHYTVEDVAAVFPDHRRYGKELAVRECPRCRNTKYKFWVDPWKAVGLCYVCGYAPRLEVLLGVARLSGVGEAATSPRDEAPSPLPPMRALKDLCMTHPASIFLTKRRFPPWVLEDYGVGYCDRGRYQRRVIFPFFGRGGRYLGFQGRVLGDARSGVPKWVTAPGTKKSEIVWNHERVLERQNWCVVTEGIFDALRMRDWAVCILGKRASDTQKQLLEYFDHIFIMLDSDATRDAHTLAHNLVDDSLFRVTVVELEKGDPADHDTAELAQRILGAAPPSFHPPAALQDHALGEPA